MSQFSIVLLSSSHVSFLNESLFSLSSSLMATDILFLSAWESHRFNQPHCFSAHVDFPRPVVAVPVCVGAQLLQLWRGGGREEREGKPSVDGFLKTLWSSASWGIIQQPCQPGFIQSWLLALSILLWSQITAPHSVVELTLSLCVCVWIYIYVYRNNTFWRFCPVSGLRGREERIQDEAATKTQVTGDEK